MSDEQTKGPIHILNLGAGVQSTALYLMLAAGEVLDEAGKPVVLRAAIFADTQDEQDATYRHLEWLMAQGGPPIMVRTIGRLSDGLMWGTNSTGQRFASIPAFVMGADGRAATGPRQCTADYKIAVVERTIRREIVGLQPRQRMPADVQIVQHFGLSKEEYRRVLRVINRFLSIKWATPRFPLVEMGMDRAKIKEWLNGRVPHEVPRSACVFCPYHRNSEWRLLKADPVAWEKILRVDAALRDPVAVCNRGRINPAYLHRSLMPIGEADLSDSPAIPANQMQFDFGDGVSAAACEGMCGV